MTKSPASSRLARLDHLAALLHADRHVTVGLLAEQLAVSSRTVARDIDLLRRRGLPIDADRGRGGGLRLDRHWGVGRIHLDIDECLDVLLAIALAEKRDSQSLMPSLVIVRRKLIATFNPNMRAKIRGIGKRLLVGKPASTAVASNLSLGGAGPLKTVRRAFVEMQRCQIDYVSETGSRTQRDIEPQYLLVNPPAWYVLAYDRLRGGARSFRSDRIKSARLIRDGFDLRPVADFDKLASSLPNLIS